MSVLIPGMEMPKSCTTEACFVQTVSYEDGTVWCPVAKGYLGDQATVCPLVPVPPHGRLIDADALPTNDKPIGKLMMFGGEYVYTQTAIDNAPIIIPADPPVMEYPQVPGITPTVIAEEGEADNV